MRIITRRTLRSIVAKNASTKVAIEYWYRVAHRSKWENSAEVLKAFPSASVIDAKRVRFKISGNDFRLVCEVDYETKTVWIKFFGTHTEYDALGRNTDAPTIHNVDMFKTKKTEAEHK